MDRFRPWRLRRLGGWIWATARERRVTDEVVTPRRWLHVAIRIVVIIAVVVGIVVMLRGLELSALGHAFASARLWPLFVAALLSFANLWCKAVSWRIMLAPRHAVSLGRLFRYTIAAFAASAIAPARAGEVLRVWVLKRRDGVPAPTSAAVAMAEKLVDGIALLVLVAPLPWLMPLPTWVLRSIPILAVVVVLVFLAAWFAIGRFRTESRFLAGLEVLRRPRDLFAVFGVLFVAWVADIGEVLLVLYAVDIDVPSGAALLVLFTLNLAIALPSTPAQFGALELGALVALVNILGVAKEPAVAFALLYHAMQIVPLVVVGLAIEWRLVVRGDANSPATPPPS